MRSQVMRQHSAQYSHAAALHGQLVDGDGHLQAANHCRAALPNDSGNGGPGLDVLDCPRHVLVSHLRRVGVKAEQLCERSRAAASGGIALIHQSQVVDGQMLNQLPTILPVVQGSLGATGKRRPVGGGGN